MSTAKLVVIYPIPTDLELNSSSVSILSNTFR